MSVAGPGRAAGERPRAGTSRGSARRSRGAAAPAGPSSTSRPAPARARPDGSARAREARRRGIDAGAVRGSERHEQPPPHPRRVPRIDAAGQPAPHLGQADETVERADAGSRAARLRCAGRARVALRSAAGSRPRAGQGRAARASASRPPRDPSGRCRLGSSRASAGRRVHLVQVREVTAREQSPWAGSGSADLECRCQRSASFAKAAAARASPGRASGCVSLASRR